ncbi:MAG TPA: hypothetical protein VKV26_25805, partial [Dehalococcoidia bacterium]|nr:hypothetical protein [Dehalococcoidia bacterium]
RNSAGYLVTFAIAPSSQSPEPPGYPGRFKQYHIPVILLGKETPKEAVCQVFEKVNTGGVSLTVFELLTATFAADDFNLRDDWDARLKRLRRHRALESVENTDFLQAISLLSTRARQLNAEADEATSERSPGISCKRKDVLKLTLLDYQEWAESVTAAFEQVARFLRSQRIFTARDLPYRTQLTPLAALFAVLGKDGENDGVQAKLARWYWCGVFGELYGGAIESRFAKDLPQVLAWIHGGVEPDTIRDANFTASRLLSVRMRISAAYKGIHALLMRGGGMDFRTGDTIDQQTYYDESIDIHHIFPRDWCVKQQMSPSVFNSIVNKTPVSARTNRMIGGNAPSSYLQHLERTAKISPERMDEILRSHLIDPGLLRADRFSEFFAAREESLIQGIERVMGKPVARDGMPTEEAEDEIDDDDAVA